MYINIYSCGQQIIGIAQRQRRCQGTDNAQLKSPMRHRLQQQEPDHRAGEQSVYGCVIRSSFEETFYCLGASSSEPRQFRCSIAGVR